MSNNEKIPQIGEILIYNGIVGLNIGKRAKVIAVRGNEMDLEPIDDFEGLFNKNNFDLDILKPGEDYFVSWEEAPLDIKIENAVKEVLEE